MAPAPERLELSGRAWALEKWARTYLFHCLLGLCKDAQSYNFLSSFSVLFEFLQCASYPLSTGAAFPWESGRHWLMRPISRGLQYMSLNTLDALVSHVRAPLLPSSLLPLALATVTALVR